MSLSRFQRGVRQLGLGSGSRLARPPAVLEEPDIRPGRRLVLLTEDRELSRNAYALSTDGSSLFFESFLTGTGSGVDEVTFPGLVFIGNSAVPADTVGARGSTPAWWTVGTDFDLYLGGSLIYTRTGHGQSQMSLTYSDVEDVFYSVDPGSAIGDPSVLVRITPGGSATDVLPLPWASAAAFQPVVTPDGAVWGLQYDYGVNATVWYRWDPGTSSGSYTTFTGPQPIDEPYVLVPRPDNSVLFSEAGVGYRLTADGTVTAEPTLDAAPDASYDFDTIYSVAQTPDCSTVVIVTTYGIFLLTG